MKAILFGSADIEDYEFCKTHMDSDAIIICCDGGIEHTKKMGQVPQYIVGDFDSATGEALEYYKNLGVSVQQFPTHKDETDMELGLNFAMELGATDILIFGGIGSRFDHTLANAHLLLRLLKKGIRGRLLNEHNCVELIDHTTEIDGHTGDLVSLIPLSMEVTGVTLEGMEYPLQEKTLKIDDELIAVSNVMLGQKAKIQVKSGYLFVIQSRD